MNMSSLALFKITWTIISLRITVLALTERFQLKPSTISSAPDISATLGAGATIINDFWSFDVNSQESADLHIQLGPSWGFHPIEQSTLTIFINGNTSLETFNSDGEIIFVFAIADKYFAELISLDTASFAYKQCPDQNKPLITRNITKMINSPFPERYFRYCNNSVDTTDPQGIDQWGNAGGSAYREAAKWPMWLTIENDPISNTVDYTYGDYAGTTPGTKRTSHFTSSFPTNQGLDIYIAGESPGEDFIIKSIDLTYSYIGTNSPTLNPITIAPTTLSPTNIPSNSPITVEPTTLQPTTVDPTMYPTTITPTTLMPTTFEPTTSFPTTLEPTTIAPTNIPTTMEPTTVNPTNMPTINPTISPTEMEFTEPPLIIPSTTERAGPVITLPDIINTNDKGMVVGDSNNNNAWNDGLYYIIGIVLLALFCVCCVILCIGLKKYKADHSSNVSIKDYKGVHVMHRQSASLQQNELYKHNNNNNNAKHIKKVSTTNTYNDNDLTNTYNEHHYKSSESKLNDTFDINKQSHDFSNHISSAVTGDELILDDIHNHMVTAGRPRTISDNNRRHIEMYGYNNNNNRKTFNENLANVAIGNNMMMNDIINQMETKKGDFDSSDLNDSNDSSDSSNSDSNESNQVQNNNNNSIHDDEYFRSGYEMGMVNVSKISEMAPQSGTKTSTKYEIDPMHQYKNMHNNDSLIMEGNTLNDDYDFNQNNNNDNDELNSDELLDEMETAGFIDGDYNQLEYDDEYYQDENDKYQ